MNAETLKLLQSETVRKRLAKLMARRCFRDTLLEDLHAGITPSSQTGDGSDINVVTPSGEIPWAELSRFNDVEMKALMIDVVQHCYDFIRLLGSPVGESMLQVLAQQDLQPSWQDPT